MPRFTAAAIRDALSAGPKKKTVADTSLSPAGVMVLTYPKLGHYQVLLNRRSNFVEDHKGQISFPGGRMERGDGTMLDTALRETCEEMGVMPRDIEVLGELDEVATVSRYRVSPFVGAIREAYPFRPSAREVAEVIEAPLNVLSAGDARRDEVRMVNGTAVRHPCYAYEGHVIWGATAKILQNLLLVLDAADDERTTS